MKVLFTTLAINAGNSGYLDYTKRLIIDILVHTPHDILLTTNEVASFKTCFRNFESRVIIRDIPTEGLILKYPREFNYNLKFLCFRELPSAYDVVVYIDGDMQLYKWGREAEEFLVPFTTTHEWGGTRLGCVLNAEINHHNAGKALFSHKIRSYDIQNAPDIEMISSACLPSEHFLVFRNIPDKLNKFAQMWAEMNAILQSKNGGEGSWGDGFEMGVSLTRAGFTNGMDISFGIIDQTLGLKFNGNKV